MYSRAILERVRAVPEQSLCACVAGGVVHRQVDVVVRSSVIPAILRHGIDCVPALCNTSTSSRDENESEFSNVLYSTQKLKNDTKMKSEKSQRAGGVYVPPHKLRAMQ